MKSARIIFFSLLCFLCFGGSADARSNSVLSKEDGSLWIATNGQGLLRVGQHGHRIQYRHTEGRIPNDTILSVVADSLGGIWIQDIAGNLLTYSSTRGFSKLAIAPVLAFSYDGDKLWACTASELFSWKPGDNPQSVVDLPINVTEMLFSPDGRLWLLGNDALCRLDNDGKLNKWEHNGSISNLLPYTFEIDTNAPVENGKGGISLWLCILISLVALVLGLLLARIFSRSPKPEPALFEPKPVVEPKHVEPKPVVIDPKPVEPKPAVVEDKPLIVRPVAVEERSLEPMVSVKEDKPVTFKPIDVEEKPVMVEPEPASRHSAFYKEVYSLCEKHLDDPDFDVEKIAALTGISRIHVNRKLKAEADVSPSAMIKQLRMEKAAALIEQRQLSLSEIALACGFSTSSYFSTAFRSYYGVTPSEYLNNVSKSK